LGWPIFELSSKLFAKKGCGQKIQQLGGKVDEGGKKERWKGWKRWGD
jgi:hypothetical protein